MSRGSISVNYLTVPYDRYAALHDFDRCFESGSMTAIVGPNGAGKSTLVKGDGRYPAASQRAAHAAGYHGT